MKGDNFSMRGMIRNMKRSIEEMKFEIFELFFAKVGLSGEDRHVI